MAYHYESQTRNEDKETINKLLKDYENHLFPMLKENWGKIKEKVFLI